MSGIDEFEQMVFMLQDWAKWMSEYNHNIGYPSRVPILSTGGHGYDTFEDVLGQADDARMKIVDACVENLTPACRAAIMRCYGLCAVFRFPRAGYPYERALEDAHADLIVSVRRKGLT